MQLTQKDDELIKSLFGYTTPDLCKALFPDTTGEVQMTLAGKVRAYERSLIATRGELYPGITDILTSLRKDGWNIVLCTLGSQVYVDTVLDGLSLRSSFDLICLNDGIHTKADHVLDVLAQSDSLAIMIGDKPVDVHAAKVNGIPSIGVLWGYGVQNEMCDATFHAADADDLSSLFARCRVFHEIMKDMGKQEIVSGRRAIIGINGVDTSGKTCFSDDFAKFLNAYGFSTECIHIDDFHNKSEKRREGAKEIDAYMANAFDLVLLNNAILVPFRDNGRVDITMPLLDLEKDEYVCEKHFVAGSSTLMIVEGTLLFREPIDRHFDYRIFLDIPFDEVIRRASTRDVPKYGAAIIDKYNSKYIPIQKKYFEANKPFERADVIVSNGNYRQPELVRRKRSV
jgi:uridine kinase/phosphoglycolate phosphatase-like HAD superfamily hydrolase